ncbi:Uncharacterized protein OBRU01_13754, partial [Operophtera brumata]
KIKVSFLKATLRSGLRIWRSLTEKLKNLLVPLSEGESRYRFLEGTRRRVKRGLIDGLGSVAKSITGNLDYTDALHYNQAMKSLENNENKLITELNNHLSLSKNWTSQYSNILDSIVDNQNKIEILVNKIKEAEASRDYDLVKYAHLAQVLIVLTDNEDSISQELLKLQNIIAFIRASATHHSRNKMCNPITVALEKPAYEELDEKHYSISFPVSTKVHLSCGQDLYKTLQGSYLAVIPQNCFLETPEFTIQALNLKIIGLPSDDFVTSSLAPAFKLNSINLNHLHVTNKEISLQSPLPLRINIDYGLYHTTIPMNVVITGACALVSGLLYRKYQLKLMKVSEDSQAELQGVYAVLTTKRVDPNQHPAQFTTSFNTRYSSGGGVTQG